LPTDTRTRLKAKTEALPKKPGIYFLKDREGSVLYIGKARSLKERVKSYFAPTSDSRIHNLIAETRDLDYILTGSEREAAFLENNFIREHQPKYNLSDEECQAGQREIFRPVQPSLRSTEHHLSCDETLWHPDLHRKDPRQEEKALPGV
jgi:hypothetical protein